MSGLFKDFYGPRLFSSNFKAEFKQFSDKQICKTITQCPAGTRGNAVAP